mgnify:CR=1 FL=1
MISLLSWRALAQGSVVLVPLLSLASPGWLKLSGMEPAWAVLWLLPLSLLEDRPGALFAALTAGLLLDALHPGPISLLPGLLSLAWWWSGLARRSLPRNSLILGLLALLPMWLRRRRVDPVVALYEQFCSLLSQHGCARGAAEGPRDFAARAELALPHAGRDLRTFTDCYVSSRYGSSAGSGEVQTIAVLRRALRDLRQSLRQ